MNTTSLLSFVHSIEGWLSDHEALFLYHAAQTVPVTGDIVEIGSWKGKSTVCLAKGNELSVNRSVVWAVDPHEGIIHDHEPKTKSTYADFQSSMKQSGGLSVIPIKKTSELAASGWKKPIRLLFIDGLHDYIHAKQDYRLWNSHVVDGGMILFHDAFCGVEGATRAVEELFLDSSKISDVGTVGSIVYGIKGESNGITTCKVHVKIRIILFAQWIYQLRGMPKFIQVFIIHRIIRLLLLNRYTLNVYLRDSV